MTPVTESQFASTNRIVHLEDARMRARERVELVTEGTTGVTLLSAAQASYSMHQTDVFVLLNGVAGAALVGAVVMGARRLLRGEGSSSGVNVIGVVGGIAGVIEGLHRLERAQFTFGHKHFALGVVTVLAGLLTTTLALVIERLEHRRSLSISDDGVRMRLNKFRRFTVPWSDLTELRMGAKQAELIRVNGRARIVPLGRLVNRDEVSHALLAAATARGVPVSSPE
ncbi:MAG: hypothetical protein M3R65_00620 [Gemmatimonadota bacterium]|nr:hypothetical protein [Gemmatimonadota bacterium]